jgi:transcription-repair coupling factor (superfamily II helicase)
VFDRSSSLALRSLLKSAAKGAGLGTRAPAVAGLTPAAAAFHAATLAQDDVVFVVVPTDGDVETFTTDARFFLSSLLGLSGDEAARRVLPFPSQEVDPWRGLAPHLEVASARARALFALANGRARLVVASARGLLPRLSEPSRLAAAGISLAEGVEIDPRELADRLATAGFLPEDPVDEHGEFCVRGGVVDIYPAAEAQPVRLEFVGDAIESVRRYDPGTQRSLEAVDRIDISPQRELLPEPGREDDPDALDRSATIVDYVRGASAVVVVFEIDDAGERGRTLDEQWRATAADLAARGQRAPAFEDIALGWVELERWLAAAQRVSQLAIEDIEHVACRPAVEHHGRIGDWVGEVRAARERGETVVFVAETPGRAERTIELLADYDVRAQDVSDAESTVRAGVLVTTGDLSRGFSLPAAGLHLVAETDLFEEDRRTHERRKSAARSFIADFRDLKIGDLVVHVDSGIGRFVGLKKLAVAAGQAEQEYMELRYAGDDKLFVPLERLDLVQKYTGGAAPALDRLGGATWEKAKTRVKKAMRDMAEELLKLYAARKAVAGHAFSTDSHWQQEFDDAFAYELTPDQRSAIAEITKDMESPTPMDRLLCGDVGFGKTEVAMRAAFKAVIDGKQVAVLAPTTVLAFQHVRTLKERFAGFPVKIDLISRFRTRQEQKAVLAKTAAGDVDVLVGTHRLLSKDVTFRDLGLLVVDEEQRFGVTHKERIKQLRKKVDVLTMTATPIPRTLNMSLAGIRDMSVIETPPRDRLSIQTQVIKFDADVVRRAIATELERGGQVYFVHNRVESIHSIGSLVARLAPEARIAVAHGQMGEDDLEKVMLDFVTHQFDVLLATTIVENGLDIPNANTIIINNADKYGLAQLYQLRGRVGRSDRRAYAYLLIPAELTLSPVARKRLAAIREFSDLGSGFRIAALDLEIRGAGNLLGGEQSGHIEAVGFDMYMKLLEQTIREFKGEELEDERRATVNLRLNLRVPESYIPDMNQRLGAYRKMASARSLEALDEQIAELRDRYGEPPAVVRNLAEYARIRLRSDRIGLESLDRQGDVAVLKFRPDAKLDPVFLMKLVEQRDDLTLLPPAVLRLDLGGWAGPGRGQAPEGTRLVRAATAAKGRPAPDEDADEDTSWWTARATTGVAPGFTREQILARAEPDPAGPGGLFEKLDELLSRLSDALVAS